MNLFSPNSLVLQSLNWAILNGSLFANNDRVFPPTMSMQLHAPRREDPAKTPSKDDMIELSYALEARPLPESRESIPTFIRVRLDLLDLKGASVTADTVVVDLLCQADGSTAISQIRSEPNQRHSGGRSYSNRPWYVNLLSTISSKDKQNLSSDEHMQPTISSASNGNKPDHLQSVGVTGSSAPDSESPLGLSSYWSPTIYSGHRDRSLMQLMHPFILPILLGAIIGLSAWLSGFVLASLFISLYACLIHRKKEGRRIPTGVVEDGISSKKGQILPRSLIEIDKTSA
jgi:hypothetical protein